MRMNKVVSIKMDEILLEQIDSYALKYNISRSEAVRRAITLLLKEEDSKTKIQIKVEKGFPIKQRLRRHKR